MDRGRLTSRENDWPVLQRVLGLEDPDGADEEDQLADPLVLVSAISARSQHAW